MANPITARAIENTAYVVAPAQTGIHYGRRQSHGHAMVIDPWGTVLSDAGKTQGAAIAPADKERVKTVSYTHLTLPTIDRV